MKKCQQCNYVWRTFRSYKFNLDQCHVFPRDNSSEIPLKKIKFKISNKVKTTVTLLVDLLHTKKQTHPHTHCLINLNFHQFENKKVLAV